MIYTYGTEFIFRVVEFRDPEHAKKAIEEYHQKKIHDRAIIVREVLQFLSMSVFISLSRTISIHSKKFILDN